MKRVIASLSLLLLLLCGATAQSISQYEYWTDDDYASRSVVSSSGGDVSLTISTATLEAGIHFLNFRACRDDGVWGNFYRYLYYIPTQKYTVSGDVKVEYWLDENLAGMESETASGDDLSLTIDVSALTSGIHYFNCRAFNERGEYGCPVREMFYIPETQTFADAKLASYEYWIDDDYANCMKGSSENAEQAFTVDVSQLSGGIHYFNYWAIDDKGRKGNLVRQLFYIARTSEAGGSEPLEYEYWIDEDVANKVTGKGTQAEYIFTIDVSSLALGSHTFNFKAKNLLDQWTDVFVDSFDVSPMLGDVNNDGKVDIVDVTMTISHISGTTPEGFIEAAADMDGSGEVDSKDLNAIISIVLQ